MNPIPVLQKGDTVVIITPAKAIDSKYVDLAKTLFESWGLVVEVGSHVNGTHHYFSGTDQERLTDLQWALDHPKAKAIITSRGGYGSVRIAPKADFSKFRENPKWMVGFSDITVFHNQMHGQLAFRSIHALAPLYLDQLEKDDLSITTLKNALFGEVLEYAISNSSWNRSGQSEGVLVGGNLAILSSLVGTSLDIDTHGKILFIEEISEYAYKLDRMMRTLDLGGKLHELAGLVVGGLTDIKSSEETFGISAEQIIRDVVKDYDFPVLFNFPAGHQLDNRALVLGEKHGLVVNSDGCTLKQLTHGTT